jgi:hypothetical protein
VDIYDIENVLSQKYDPRRGRWVSTGAAPEKRAATTAAANAQAASPNAAATPKASQKSVEAKAKGSTGGKGKTATRSKTPRNIFISSNNDSSPDSTQPKGEATTSAGHAPAEAPADAAATAAAWAAAAAAAATPSPTSTLTASPSREAMGSPVSSYKRGDNKPVSSTPTCATRVVAKALEMSGRSLRSTPGAKTHLEMQEEGVPPRSADFTPSSTKKPQLAALEAVLKGQYAQYTNKKRKRSSPKPKAAAKQPKVGDLFPVEKVRVYTAPPLYHFR